VLDARESAVELAATQTVKIEDTVTLTIDGAGSLSLPNTVFKPGAYVAAGDVTVTAVAAGDTIETAATDDSKKLTVGTVVLGKTTSVTTAVTYTFVKGADDSPVELDGTAGTVKVPAGGSVTAGASAQMTLGTGSSLELVAGTSTANGAALKGAGSVVAGHTTIVGGASDGWQAIEGTGSVTVTATSAVKTTLAASGGAKLVAANTGATITQAAGTAGNNLLIASNTTVHLKGAVGTAMGTITLGSGGSPGKLTLNDGTSIILIGSGIGGSDYTATAIKLDGKGAIAVTGDLDVTDFKIVTDTSKDYLVQVGGNHGGSIEASTTASNDAVFASDSEVTQ
jgi:hypothetical protein